MVKTRLLVLDILKPHRPTILEYAKEIVSKNKEYSVNLRVVEIDEKTETVELTIQGVDVELEKIENIISSLGGTIHSIDEVSVGAKLVNSRRVLEK